MRKVLIVDDEAIIRVTLRSMVHWEDYGLEIAADCSNGFAALEYMQTHHIDLLLTDVKMPEMSGIELLRRLNEEGEAPITLMLSGYNEFDLVREAFRLGVCDYLLKADINEGKLGNYLQKLTAKYWSEPEKPQDSNSNGKVSSDDEDYKMEDETGISAGSLDKDSNAYRNANGDRNKNENSSGSWNESSDRNTDNGLRFPTEGTYGVAILEVDDFKRQTARFGENLKEMLERPMMDLAAQIPRVNKRGILTAIQPGHYIFFYKVTDQNFYHRDMLSVIRQVQAVWRDFMNLSVSAAVMESVSAEQLEQTLDRAQDFMLLAPLSGKGSIVTEWEQKNLANEIATAGKRYERMLTFLYEADEIGFEKEKEKFFQILDPMETEEAVEETLRMLALLAMKFREYEEDFFAVFPEEVNYYEKLGRIKGIRELQLWLGNYFRWQLEYLGNRLNGRQADVMQRARRFIADNFANPELTLGSVAAYVGFNEKYFTTRFTKEVGTNFRDYLTDIRLNRAKKLMETTDLKMYEISDRVGYNNVEHFSRMFKKHFGISPGDYKKDLRIKI